LYEISERYEINFKETGCLICLSLLLSLSCTHTQKTEESALFEVPEMTEIPAGTFTMGQILGEFRLGFPLHTVIIPNGFKLGTYEVSNAQFCQMLNNALLQVELSGDYKQNLSVKNRSGDSRVLLNLEADYKGTRNPIRFEKSRFVVSDEEASLPVVYVTWYGAAFYCNMLSRSEGLEETYDLNSWNSN